CRRVNAIPQIPTIAKTLGSRLRWQNSECRASGADRRIGGMRPVVRLVEAGTSAAPCRRQHRASRQFRFYERAGGLRSAEYCTSIAALRGQSLLSEVEGNVRATRFVVIKSIGMTVSVKSFAKINLGLRIGSQRADGFHELRTVYQTIALNDIVRVSAGRGSGIEIRCDDPRVPHDCSNTCWRIVDVAMRTMKARGRVIIEIEKRLPVQGGLGGASGNAVAALIALERALQKQISGPERLRIAAEVGSDLPLFLVGGSVLGVGRGEEVYPLPDLAAMACVIALPEIAVSTPKAFAEWDRLIASRMSEKQVPRLRRSLFASEQASSLGMTHAGGKRDNAAVGKLTVPAHSDRMLEFGREISAWLNAGPVAGKPRRSGVSARSGGRAENPLLDLVRTGIENDFEK